MFCHQYIKHTAHCSKVAKHLYVLVPLQRVTFQEKKGARPVHAPLLFLQRRNGDRLTDDRQSRLTRELSTRVVLFYRPRRRRALQLVENPHNGQIYRSTRKLSLLKLSLHSRTSFMIIKCYRVWIYMCPVFWGASCCCCYAFPCHVNMTMCERAERWDGQSIKMDYFGRLFDFPSSVGSS